MQDMKPQEPDPRGSPESGTGRGPGHGLPGDLGAQNRGGGHSLAAALGWAQSLQLPRRPPLWDLGSAKEWGWGVCRAIQAREGRPVWIQFRPLPRSQILISAPWREVSDLQPGLAPWLPWGPCRMNEEGAALWASPRGPSPAGPSRSPSLSWYLLPAFTSSPRHYPPSTRVGPATNPQL